jgi:hypothetical protein
VDEMIQKKKIAIVMMIALVVGFLFVNKAEISEEKDAIILKTTEVAKTIDPVDLEPLIEIWTRDNLIKYINEESKLGEDVSTYLYDQCIEKELDPVLVLGLIKLESNFDTNLVSYAGARGLGQLMENTAKPWAKNLGIEYSREKLFEPKYNIRLFTSHLQYLFKVYDNDIHQVLTAYNRGQGGLKKYVASRGGHRNPAESVYSNRVIQLTSNYRKNLENEQ